MLVGGLDIGGTKTGACVARVSSDGNVQDLVDREFETDPHSAPEEQLRRAVAGIDELAGDGVVETIGVSCPGPFNRRTGTLLRVPNMPAWQQFELSGWFEKIGRRAAVMNDANAGALAEWQWGGFGRPEVLVFLTMSTGLGAGIVVDGRVLEGPLGFAGEVGRIRLTEEGPVGFGARGTAEGYASGPGLVQLARSEILRRRQAGEPVSLAETDLTARMICDAASHGDEAALAVVKHSAERLGELIAILSNVLEPSLFVLGTIGARHPEMFVPTALQTARRHVHSEIVHRLDIRPSTLTHRWQHQAIAAATLT